MGGKPARFQRTAFTKRLAQKLHCNDAGKCGIEATKMYWRSPQSPALLIEKKYEGGLP